MGARKCCHIISLDGSARPMNRRIIKMIPFLLCAPLLASCGTSTPSDFGLWKINPSKYELEPLSTLFTASFVRGDDVLISCESGEILRLSDADPARPPISMGTPDAGGALLLHITRSGAILSAAFHRPVYRTDDGGASWTQVLPTPCWRMDEDDLGHLYAGNYTKDAQSVATLFKSRDDGRTWSTILNLADNQHIHTVRWDDIAKRLYIAFGDSRMRGQAYSDDRGVTFDIMNQGTDQGFTDLALLDQSLMWCSDDGTGRVYRQDRTSGWIETVTRGSGYMWFGVGEGKQLFVGSVASRTGGGDRGALLATDDNGDTWTKILETRVSTQPYSAVIHADSRHLSPGGWLYFTADLDDGAQSFRVRRRP